MKRISLVLLLITTFFGGYAQDELLDLLEGEDTGENFVSSTFKSTRLVNGHTVEVRAKGVLEFVISHRFGTINSGHEQFWGLDDSSIRLALEYGLSDKLNIGLGRSSFSKVIDTFAKYRLIRQSNNTPITVTAFGSIARKTVQQEGLSGVDRYAYTGQVLVARKFNSNLSLQLMPTIIQRNLVPTLQDDNLLIALGIGGRYKLTNRVAINMEYYPQLSDYSEEFQDAFAVGFDIETGGHVFQLHLTNAVQMNERGFIGETRDSFFDGDIHYGFNVSRVFDLRPND